MPIDVVCQCGKKLVAKDELAGKTVRCPQCKQPLVIRAPQAEPLAGGIGDLLDEEGYVAPPTAENACPSCGKEFRADAVICVHCGLDRRSGKKVAVTRIKEAPRPSLEVGSPYKSPQAGGSTTGRRRDIQSIATFQKGILFSILLRLMITVVAIVINLAQIEMPFAILIILNLISIATVVISAVFVILLGMKVYNTALGILFGILACIPCIGLIFLLIVNGKATSILRENGISVGLMGAK